MYSSGGENPSDSPLRLAHPSSHLHHILTPRFAHIHTFQTLHIEAYPGESCQTSNVDKLILLISCAILNIKGWVY